MSEARAPKVQLGLFPTPIQELTAASKLLGANRRLLVKRDDLCAGLLDMNKRSLFGENDTIVFVHTGGLCTMAAAMEHAGRGFAGNHGQSSALREERG